jgi:hypothetical protein
MQHAHRQESSNAFFSLRQHLRSNILFDNPFFDGSACSRLRSTLRPHAEHKQHWRPRAGLCDGEWEEAPCRRPVPTRLAILACDRPPACPRSGCAGVEARTGSRAGGFGKNNKLGLGWSSRKCTLHTTKPGQPKTVAAPCWYCCEWRCADHCRCTRESIPAGRKPRRYARPTPKAAPRPKGKAKAKAKANAKAKAKAKAAAVVAGASSGGPAAPLDELCLPSCELVDLARWWAKLVSEVGKARVVELATYCFDDEALFEAMLLGSAARNRPQTFNFPPARSLSPVRNSRARHGERANGRARRSVGVLGSVLDCCLACSAGGSS